MTSIGIEGFAIFAVIAAMAAVLIIIGVCAAYLRLLKESRVLEKEFSRNVENISELLAEKGLWAKGTTSPKDWRNFESRGSRFGVVMRSLFP